MRSLLNLVCVGLLWVGGVACAQNPETRPDEGFLRIVSLVAAGEGTLELTMEGKDHWPAGFKLGDRTGGFKMKTGKVGFVLKKKGCKSSKREVDVQRGKTITLVCYADPIRDEGGVVIDWELKIATLKQRSEPDGLFFTMVSFFEEEEVELKVVDSLSEKEQIVIAPQRRAVRVRVEHGLVNVRISHKEQLLKALSTKRRGNYVVMLYTDADGERKTVTFYDRKFVLAN